MAGPSVAFSASLSASGEVYLKDTDVSPSVVYKRVFTNSGNAYDSTTGTVAGNTPLQQRHSVTHSMSNIDYKVSKILLGAFTFVWATSKGSMRNITNLSPIH